MTLSSDDPAFSNADWVRQFILSPGMGWRWNRTTTIFNTIIGTADYLISLPTFGWIEKAVVINPNNGNAVQELDVCLDLLYDADANIPNKISAQFDDDAGNITFRLFPVPDQVYQVVVTSQKAAPLFANTTDTWAPIPDYLSYLYNQGMLAKTYEYVNDPRYPGAVQLFLQQVVSANQGLTDSQRNIFLNERNTNAREQLLVQQGRS